MGTVFTGFTNLLGLVSPSGVSTSASQSFTSATPKSGSQEDLSRPMSLIGITDKGSEIIGNNLWLLVLLLAEISFVLAVFNLLPILPSTAVTRSSCCTSGSRRRCATGASTSTTASSSR